VFRIMVLEVADPIALSSCAIAADNFRTIACVALICRGTNLSAGSPGRGQLVQSNIVDAMATQKHEHQARDYEQV
jgi:hypothetical protein